MACNQQDGQEVSDSRVVWQDQNQMLNFRLETVKRSCSPECRSILHESYKSEKKSIRAGFRNILRKFSYTEFQLLFVLPTRFSHKPCKTKVYLVSAAQLILYEQIYSCPLQNSQVGAVSTVYFARQSDERLFLASCSRK